MKEHDRLALARTLLERKLAARRIVLELGLREMTGRGRFRAWGIIKEHDEGASTLVA